MVSVYVITLPIPSYVYDSETSLPPTIVDTLITL